MEVSSIHHCVGPPSSVTSIKSDGTVNAIHVLPAFPSDSLQIVNADDRRTYCDSGQLIHTHPSYHMNFLLTLNTIEHPFPINTVKLSITRLYLLFSDVGVSTFYKNPNHMYLDQVMWLCVMISHDRYFINIINFMKMCDRVTFVVKVLSLLHMWRRHNCENEVCVMVLRHHIRHNVNIGALLLCKYS